MLLPIVNTGKDALLSMHYPALDRNELNSKQVFAFPVEPLACFGSSRVYHCNKNICSRFTQCEQSVSPWSPG